MTLMATTSNRFVGERMRAARRGAALALASALLLGAAARSVGAPPPRPALDRPNLVILFCDDAGYGDIGANGSPTVHTPEIDRMAREGMRFTQFYSASPACSASRYGLLTGRYPKRSGFSWVLSPDSVIGVHSNELVLAEGLKTRGYAAAAFGKWHLGVGTGGIAGLATNREFLPLQNGFDAYYGIPYSNDMSPSVLVENNTQVQANPDQRLLTAAYTDRAVQFIADHRDEPFFVYVPYNMPHIPLHPGESFAGTSRNGTYGDVMEEIDGGVGRVLRTLREQGLEQNTLVFFTSDNGPWNLKGPFLSGSSGPFRDCKGSTWEGGMRMPAVAWWPGTVPSNAVCREVASTLDLYTTALALAGRTPPADRTVDGRDIRPLLTATGTLPEHFFAYYGSGGDLYAARRGPWKLHVKTYSQLGTNHGWPGVSWSNPLLFHLEHDPSETRNVAADYPGIVDDLKAEITAHQHAVSAEGTFWD